ncbi:hypothetical protein ZWY2020_035193 [Hordeum vulgare]|nr:hypothetical protein ZWY2020_035193 [Hordeum vulgare]
MAARRTEVVEGPQEAVAPIDAFLSRLQLRPDKQYNLRMLQQIGPDKIEALYHELNATDLNLVTVQRPPARRSLELIAPPPPMETRLRCSPRLELAWFQT